jgi:hypothetical protein
MPSHSQVEGPEYIDLINESNLQDNRHKKENLCSKVAHEGKIKKKRFLIAYLFNIQVL